MGRRRHELDIIAEILALCRTPIVKTQIMYKARLSFAQLKEYLKHLKEIGLIAEEREGWKTTEKGKKYIEVFKQLQELLR